MLRQDVAIQEAHTGEHPDGQKIGVELGQDMARRDPRGEPDGPEFAARSGG
jgi:hypothetical protein